MGRTQTIDSIALILSKIQFRDWEFSVGPSGESYLMQVCFTAIDSKTSVPAKQSGRKWYISRFATKSEIVQTALKAVLTALEHEAREDFKYRGETIFAPHFDVDSMVEGCFDLDMRIPPGAIF